MNSSNATCLRFFYRTGLYAVMVFGGLAPVAAQEQLSTTLNTSTLSSVTVPASAPATHNATGPRSSAALTAPASGNPYGLSALWLQGDWVAKGCLLLLASMSMASWYALLVRAFVLRRLSRQLALAHQVFEDVRYFPTQLAKLSKTNPLRYIADAGSAAVHQYAALRPRVDYDTWLVRAIEQALAGLQIRMQGGMAVLATIGSTAPFVGLFGTVWAIYSALVKIGASGQASIDRVAGPVGEALIMTAIGLAVAVPAVFGYNWLLRKNKLAFESLRNFATRLHAVLLVTADRLQPAEVSVPAAAAGSLVDPGSKV